MNNSNNSGTTSLNTNCNFLSKGDGNFQFASHSSLCDMGDTPDKPYLHYHTGTMYSGKTTMLIKHKVDLDDYIEKTSKVIDDALNKIDKRESTVSKPKPTIMKDKVVVLKCSPTHKGSDLQEHILSSRKGTWCRGWMFGPDTDLSILDMLHHAYVLIDEAQFMTSKQVDQLQQIKTCNINCYGLRADVNKRPFEGSAALMACCDKLTFFTSICSMCQNVRATHNELRVKIDKCMQNDVCAKRAKLDEAKTDQHQESTDSHEDVKDVPANSTYIHENDDAMYGVVCSKCSFKINNSPLAGAKRCKDA